jgi:methylmalonyl-CoA mutase N-terminal domain/subunit
MSEGEEQVELLRIDPASEREQADRVAALRGRRDAAAVESALAEVRTAAEGDANVLFSIRESLRSLATVGEVCDVLRAAWGTYDAQRARP